jgi:hypothetical protein
MKVILNRQGRQELICGFVCSCAMIDSAFITKAATLNSQYLSFLGDLGVLGG